VRLLSKSIIPPLLAVLAVLVAAPAFGVEPDEKLDDPVLEARAREIGQVLRCVVCQNQSIDDSNAPLAKDLRLLVRERLLAGDANDEVIEYVAARYGDYVLLKPRMSGTTLFLWLAPGLALAVGGLSTWLVLRARTKAPPAPLSPAEAARLDELSS